MEGEVWYQETIFKTNLCGVQLPLSEILSLAQTTTWKSPRQTSAGVLWRSLPQSLLSLSLWAYKNHPLLMPLNTTDCTIIALRQNVFMQCIGGTPTTLLVQHNYTFLRITHVTKVYLKIITQRKNYVRK